MHAHGGGWPAGGGGHVCTEVDFIKLVVFGIDSFPGMTGKKEEKQLVTVLGLPTNFSLLSGPDHICSKLPQTGRHFHWRGCECQACTPDRKPGQGWLPRTL